VRNIDYLCLELVQLKINIKPKLMKTIYKSILVIIVLFLSGMTINTNYAGKPAIEKVFSTKNIQNLAPVTPIEADFNDADITLAFDIITLAPTMPIEADFNTDSIDLTFDIRTWAPTTPAEADFSDSL
jgi:hypothetical protein